MTPEHLQQLEELYHCALEASSDADRVLLLQQADPELRRQVESLLARKDDRLILDHSLPSPLDPTLTVLSTGARLGPYQVESKIGEGGMGQVFRAVDTRLGRPVAIKIVNERFSARFEREARAISSLNHPNICTLYDIGPNYLVMELIKGETLAARLKRGQLPIDEALACARQITAALVAAHERGIVHRDLKPGNIMLANPGVKVLDFGLASLEGDDALTATHMVIGTPAYMAPEQREGKPSDARTDLYSFGCVLFEMLTGTRVTADRRPVSSKALESIVGRCLESDPARRWQSASELAGALEGAPLAKKSPIWIFAATAIAAAAVIAGSFFFLRPTPKLTDRDIIVLADFVNSTGDPVFDGTLRQGLAIQLEQSPFLKIMDDQQVQGVLALMSLSPAARISNQVAHDICIREAAAATIDGAIASLGKSYVVTLQAIACHDGATLAREQIQAEDKEHVLNALGTATTAMRAKLGESRSTIQKLNRPLEQATTASLEALQNYSEGYSQIKQGNFLAAVPLLERAKSIDPNFAMAYYLLGVAFVNASDSPRGLENAKQAFLLINRVSEFERDQIAPHYYAATGELGKALDAYQLGIRSYPRTWEFHNELSLTYLDLGRFEEGLKEGQEAARLQANAEPPFRRQLDAYLSLDRLADAKDLARKVLAQGIDGALIHQRLLVMALFEGDPAAIAKETQWFAGKPEEYISFHIQAVNRRVHGQRMEAHRLFQRSEETLIRRGLRNTASRYEEDDAVGGALLGNCQAVRKLGRPAFGLALCGDEAGAEKLAAEISKVFPNGTLWNAVELPVIRAAIELNRDQPAKSLELLASASPYERVFFNAVYLRGLAYLRLHKGAEAAAEFRKIAEHKGANWGSAWRSGVNVQYYSLSYLFLARALVLKDDSAMAKKAYHDFFELWKDADPDITILREAKAEYAKLP